MGGTVREAQEYCKREGLGLGQALILADYYGIARASRPGYKLRFIGRFHERADAGQITAEARSRGLTVEDMTDV